MRGERRGGWYGALLRVGRWAHFCIYKDRFLGEKFSSKVLSSSILWGTAYEFPRGDGEVEHENPSRLLILFAWVHAMHAFYVTWVRKDFTLILPYFLTIDNSYTINVRNGQLSWASRWARCRESSTDIQRSPAGSSLTHPKPAKIPLLFRAIR